MTEYKLVPVDTIRRAASILGSQGFDAWDQLASELDGIVTAPDVQPHDVESVWMYRGNDSEWKPFMNEQHRLNTIADGGWDVREFFATPVMQGEPVAPSTRDKREKWIKHIRDAMVHGVPQHVRNSLEQVIKGIEYSIEYGGTRRLLDRIAELEALSAEHKPRTDEQGESLLVGYIRRSAIELMENDELGVRANITKEPRYSDCVAIYATTQPSEQQPDITQLVEALEGLLPFVTSDSVECRGDKCREHWCLSCWDEETVRETVKNIRTAIAKADDALSAYRKQGGE